MRYEAKSPKEYIDQLPEDRKKVIKKMRAVIRKNLPPKFKEAMSYGMIGYVIPHSVYPDGYHCDPKLPLPFMSIASQKGFVALYHMGIYANPKLLKWFQGEFKKRVPGKLDMGKSCIRFKKLETIPYDLIGELVARMTADEMIKLYDTSIKGARKKK